jgi:iron complex outermembrane receptor protein
MKSVQITGDKHYFQAGKRLLSSALLPASLALATLSSHHAIAAEQKEAQAETKTLEAVTVTGEKIDRTLQETTTAVTVLGSDEVDTGEYQSVNELVESVPNMITNPYGAPNIRGIDGTGPAVGVFSFTTGARPRISTTVDGQTESWSGQEYMNASLWDVEQVEVLRGPQSTTQGRNSIGGAIVVQTKDPTFYWEGGVRAGYESADSKQQLAAVISGPLIEDELAFRLAASGYEGTGYIEYPLEGDDWPWDPAESKHTNVRAKLLWKPSALSGMYAKFTLTQRDQEGEYLNFVNGDDYFDYKLDGNNSNTRYQDTDTTTASTEFGFALSNSLSLEILLGWSEYNASFEQYSNQFELQLEEESQTFESKLVYNPADGKSSGVVGVYAYQRDQKLDTEPQDFFGDDNVKTVALFGEGTFAISNALKLIVGGRAEREEQDRDVAAWPGFPWGGQVVTNTAETLFLPKAGIDYEVASGKNLSFTVRKGYNPGGGALDWDNGDFYEYDKEEVITYEINSRNSIMNNKVSIIAAVFFNQYDDLQALLDNRLVNINEGESYGLELEANALIDTGFNVFGSVGLLHTKITEANEENPEIEGNEFGYAPSNTVRVGFEKHFSSGVFFGADSSYVNQYFSDVTNNQELTAGDYILLNAHAGYETENYTIRVYARNLTDEEVLYRQTDGFVPEAQVGPPLTAGITADYHF